MNIQDIKDKIGNHAKDIKLNISKVLSADGAPDLTAEQIAGVALGCAYTVKNKQLVEALIEELSPNERVVQAAAAAASIMAMNNVYYRFLHLSEDTDYKQLPANLRMNAMKQTDVSKLDFELIGLAISTINGCGLCMASHSKQVVSAGLSKVGAQSAVRIASVVHACHQALFIAETQR